MNRGRKRIPQDGHVSPPGSWYLVASVELIVSRDLAIEFFNQGRAWSLTTHHRIVACMVRRLVVCFSSVETKEQSIVYDGNERTSGNIFVAAAAVKSALEAAISARFPSPAFLPGYLAERHCASSPDHRARVDLPLSLLGKLFH